MQRKIKTVANYTPHSGKMLLLDLIVDTNDNSVTTQVVINKNTMFLTSKGVPSYIGIEYMAQSIAVYAGALGEKTGDKPKIGFLLGSRNYKSNYPFFKIGDTLTIIVTSKYIDNSGLALFDCKITWGDNLEKEATAGLNVFHTENIADYFK